MFDDADADDDGADDSAVVGEDDVAVFLNKPHERLYREDADCGGGDNADYCCADV